MKKIVFLVLYPLTLQIERYLFISDLTAAAFEVEYWDLSEIYFKGFPFENTINRECVRKISTLADVRQRIRKEDRETTLFVAQTNFNWQTLSLFYMLTCCKCQIGYFPLTVLPVGSYVQRVTEKLGGFIFSPAFRQSCLNVLAKAFRKLGMVKPYDLIFISGRLTRESFQKHSRRVVNINYFDYDRYIATRDSSIRLEEAPYCVFLDEGAIANEDNRIVKNASLNPAAYYGALNGFFDYIERKFSVRVVIAAHPGIYYDKNIFVGKKIFEGKTCDLVKNCEFVISQSSMSVSFAVLFRKPIIFIFTDEYLEKRPMNWRLMCFYSELLKRETTNISTLGSCSINAILPVDPEAYDNYKYMLLSSKESEEKSSKEIVIQTLSGL